MNALNEAAKTVETAWCKGSMKREEESKGAGDTYCAVGALVSRLSQVRGLSIDYNPEVVGNHDDLLEYIDAREVWQNSSRKFKDFPKYENYNVNNFERFISESLEGQLLAIKILENYPGVTGYNLDSVLKDISEGKYYDVADIIITFNDDDDTTREDVVAMMEKAAVAYDDAIAFEEKTTDDLVAEIDELVSA